MVNTLHTVETGEQDETGELKVEQTTKKSVAQILFNPSDPKYKKVKDLPPAIQDHYIDFEDGFIRESAYKNYEHVKKQAKTNARAKDRASISLKVIADDKGGNEREDYERRERKVYLLSLAQKMYNFFFYNQTKKRLSKYEQDILYTQAQNFEIDSDKHIASKEKDKERRDNETELVSLLDKMEKGLNDMGVKGFVYVRGGGMDIGPASMLEGEINGRKLKIRWTDKNNYYDGTIDNVKLTKTEIKDLLKKYLSIAVPMFHGGFSKEEPFLAERRGYMADIYTKDGNKYYSSSEQENLKEPLHVEEIKFIEGYGRELLKSKGKKIRGEIIKDVI